jgi:methylmalonyl-CoA mutase
LGPPQDHSARLELVRDVLAAGGIVAEVPRVARAPGNGWQVRSFVEQFRESGARTVVLCGSDASYAESLPELAVALRTAGAQPVVLAGRPEPDRDRGAIDLHLLHGCDAVEILTKILDSYEQGFSS